MPTGVLSIEMLLAALGGATYDRVAEDFGVTRTAVQKRVNFVAARLAASGAVEGLNSREGTSIRRLRKRRDEVEAALQPHEGQTPVALVVGEFKTCDRAPLGCRVWIRHMPDLPLRMPMKSWDRLVRQHGPMLDAWHEDATHRMRIAMAALVRASSECAIEVEAATLMLVSKDWIPLEGVHELALVEALITQGRRFVKPLRYDAAHAGGFANALLLDAGPTPLPMHVWSGFLPKAELALKERAMAGEQGWSLRTSEPMPDFPPRARYGPLSAFRVTKPGSADA
ncbi:DUF1173 family protein [Pseudorhodoferax sp.]|uniref:DUF1173 family protein n=1 Tax=Pseudorhodoferax sp. TaxID=1993553 RepID=UPI002DD6A92B|nr:DUF1173 family protein [Pseudorhodoferax sp.]